MLLFKQLRAGARHLDIPPFDPAASLIYLTLIPHPRHARPT